MNVTIVTALFFIEKCPFGNILSHLHVVMLSETDSETDFGEFRTNKSDMK